MFYKKNVSEARKIIGIEKLFKIKVINVSVVIAILMLVIEVIVYQAVVTNKVPYDYCLNIFQEDTPIKTEVYQSYDTSNEAGITMHIDNVEVNNKIITVKMSGKNLTCNQVDLAYGKNYMLSVIYEDKSPIRKLFYRRVKTTCIANAQSDFSFKLYFDTCDIDLSNGICTLSIQQTNSDTTTEFILPIDSNTLKDHCQQNTRKKS